MTQEEDPRSADRIAIEQARRVYQEGDVLAHFANPDRHGAAAGWWGIANMGEYAPEGGHVLVVGCAGGMESFALLRAGFRVTGVDIVPEFIEAARRQAEAKGFADRARFETVDGFSWPVADASCDAVTMLANMMSYLPTGDIRRQVFRECFRVLKDTGAVLLDCNDRTNPAWRTYTPPEWEPDRSEDVRQKAEWRLTEAPGVSVKPGHPCKGDQNTEAVCPTYEMDPREAWAEIESAGLFVHSVMRSRPQEAKPWRAYIIATKDRTAA
jgi:SAM-dependent methyltransferase